MFLKRLNELISDRKITKNKLLTDLALARGSFVNWEQRGTIPNGDTLKKIADYFGVTVDYLLGIENNGVNITDDYTTFPVLGEIAAGYDSIGAENWNGDTLNIPNEWLKGRDKSEFFVLSVKGDSMYPLYLDGDKVLILKSSTLNYSGQVGAVLYDDEYTTLKKVEYKPGEDWLNLVPINPVYPPQRIENEALEHCHIMGIPKMLIREMKE